MSTTRSKTKRKRTQCHIRPVTSKETQSSGVDARITRRGCFRADAGLIDLGFSLAFSLYSSVKSGIFNVILVNFCLNILFNGTISVAQNGCILNNATRTRSKSRARYPSLFIACLVLSGWEYVWGFSLSGGNPRWIHGFYWYKCKCNVTVWHLKGIWYSVFHLWYDRDEACTVS